MSDEKRNENETTKQSDSRAVAFFVVIVLALSAVGFASGTRMSTEDLKNAALSHPKQAAEANATPAKSYRELRASARGQSGWNESASLAQRNMPSLHDGVDLSETSKSAALSKRAKNRAYHGAPPTIPHAVAQNSVAECMACHGEGLRLGVARATTLPHDNFVSCTQCHVAETIPDLHATNLPPDPRAVDNTFTGLQPPEKGSRAWNIAPPQIPHTTFMKENCLSCHGVNGDQAMRSTHPARVNCQQCHASSANEDKRPGLHFFSANQKRK